MSGELKQWGPVEILEDVCHEGDSHAYRITTISAGLKEIDGKIQCAINKTMLTLAHSPYSEENYEEAVNTIQAHFDLLESQGFE